MCSDVAKQGNVFIVRKGGRGQSERSWAVLMRLSSCRKVESFCFCFLFAFSKVNTHTSSCSPPRWGPRSHPLPSSRLCLLDGVRRRCARNLPQTPHRQGRCLTGRRKTFKTFQTCCPIPLETWLEAAWPVPDSLLVYFSSCQEGGVKGGLWLWMEKPQGQ